MGSQAKSPDAEAQRVLLKLGIQQAPIPVERIAEQLGLAVERADLGPEVSGLLVVKEQHGIIGVNVQHSTTRQRFTIAHEIGHFLMHRDRMPVFIDRQFLTAYLASFRNARSATGEDHREREANAFAASLLMPKALVQSAVDEFGSDVSDSDAIELLAKRFHVSKQAMTFRVANLVDSGPRSDAKSVERRTRPAKERVTSKTQK